MEELVGSDRCNIYTGPEVVEFDGIPIQFMPWINAGNYELAMTALKTSPAQILMGHLEVNGFEMHKGYMAEGSFDKELFRRFDLCLVDTFITNPMMVIYIIWAIRMRLHGVTTMIQKVFIFLIQRTGN